MATKNYKTRTNYKPGLCMKFYCKNRNKQCDNCVNFSNYILPFKSKCCNAECKLGGLPDFIGSDIICTMYYVCTKCGKDCDIK